MKLIYTSKHTDNQSIIYLVKKGVNLSDFPLTAKEKDFVKKQIHAKKKLIQLNLLQRWIFFQVVDDSIKGDHLLEWLRVKAYKLQKAINSEGLKGVTIIDKTDNKQWVLSLVEGLALSNYQFLKYLKKKKEKKNSFDTIRVISKAVKKEDIDELQNIIEGVYSARDLINEPLSTLTAVQLSKEIQELGSQSGFKVEVFNKKKIESLKMGGLLAVNRGSIDPPTFSVLEWNPKNAVNKKPLVLVGKGIVYDTGGLSLKPTKESMDYMKSDMSGGAAVVGALYAVAKSALPVHVIGLIPATDNRPDGNAYVPGDIVIMGNGLSVEVLNTDAEGRMILAEALNYAKNYNPGLVMDLATLTGSAAIAVGIYGIVGMGNADNKVFSSLKESGERVSERIVEFPFWKEYNKLLKSDVADLKNIGGRDAGAITAGKFLEYFTDYPFIHLDIAGPAFVKKEYNYHGIGGTGYGVRLLFDFIKNYPQI